MDEAVRIYVPVNKRVAVEDVEVTKQSNRQEKQPEDQKQSGNSKWKFFFNGKIWAEVLERREAWQKELEEKYPWAEILYNWMIAGLIVALFISFIIWGVHTWSDNRAVAYAEATLAGYQAEQNAIAQAEADRIAAEKASEKTNLEAMTLVGQKMAYGIRNFIDKYHYSEKDIRTYIRCPLDRLDKELAAMTPEEREKLTYSDLSEMFERIVSKKDQFLAYSDSNLPLNEYHDTIYNEIETWLHETSKPWDISYEFAELRPDGIFLSNQFGADGYARRVRY